jgi:hypothetical protein
MASDPVRLLARLGFDGEGVWVEELPHNRWLTPGVWRVRNDTGLDAVLKHMSAERERGQTEWESHWTADDRRPSRWTYWAREILAYREGLIASYQGISAPEYLGSHLGETEALLLTAWVDGTPGETWDVPTFGGAAEAIGRAQGRFLAGCQWPDFPWLSRGYLRDYSSEKPVVWSLLDDDDAWGHPLAKTCFPDGLRPAVNLLHDNRERLYQVHDALPQTLCHLDFWPKNLLLRDDGGVVVIDWSFVGAGAVGEDVGNLVPDASFDHFVPAAALAELEEVVFDGYVQGLRDAGWNGDTRLVQLGMWSSSVKYDWLAPFTLAQLRQAEHFQYGGAETVDPAYRFAERGQALLFNARWAQRALELAADLGL